MSVHYHSCLAQGGKHMRKWQEEAGSGTEHKQVPH